MVEEQDNRIGELVLFFLGGLTGTFLAVRLARSAHPQLERVRAALQETVDGVESAAGYVRSLVAPLHGLLDDAEALASGVNRAIDSYRELGRYPDRPAPYTVEGGAPN